MTWKKLMENVCHEWKDTTVKPPGDNMGAASHSYLEVGLGGH